MSESVEASPELGPLNIDYLGMYEDAGSTGRAFYIILFLAWSGYLVYLCKFYRVNFFGSFLCIGYLLFRLEFYMPA
jgi:hypothetical protein